MKREGEKRGCVAKEEYTCAGSRKLLMSLTHCSDVARCLSLLLTGLNRRALLLHHGLV